MDESVKFLGLRSAEYTPISQFDPEWGQEGDFYFFSLADVSTMIQVKADYLAAGANRHPAAADWDETDVLAFGADRNIALWRPQVRMKSSSHAILQTILHMFSFQVHR